MASRVNPVNLVKNFGDTFDGSIGNALKYGIGGVIATIFIGFSLVVDTLRQLITNPVGAIISGVTEFFDAIIGGSADLIRQGVETSIQSVAPGAGWAIGPFTFALTVGVWGLALYVFTQVMDLEATSNLIPFSMTDIPGPFGSDESEDDG